MQVLQQYGGGGGESIRERDARQMVSKSSEGAAHEWSTVVDISIHPPSIKPVSLSLSRSPLIQSTQTSLF